MDKVLRPHPAAQQRFDLTGRVAWVLGGAGLLGSAVSRALAEHGATVVISDLRDVVAQEAADALRADELLAEARRVDIADESEVGAVAKAILEDHGRLDVVVNMTWFYTRKAWDELSAADFEAGLRVSLTGAFVATREAGRIMREQGHGSIIHFSSMYGVVSPDPRMYTQPQFMNPIDYGVAKAGILQMVRYQAVQLATQGVRVNAIVPGPFPIPSQHGQDEAFMKRLRDKVPMGRVGNASEIAGAVVFLASDAASYVTGTQIVVDGGWTAW